MRKPSCDNCILAKRCWYFEQEKDQGKDCKDFKPKPIMRKGDDFVWESE